MQREPVHIQDVTPRAKPEEIARTISLSLTEREYLIMRSSLLREMVTAPEALVQALNHIVNKVTEAGENRWQAN